MIITLLISMGTLLTFGEVHAAPVQVTGNQSRSSASFAASSTQRIVTLTNATQHTVWAVSTGNPGYTPPDAGEWKLARGQTITLTYPSIWNGRIWARTGCSFDDVSGQGSCETGDCGNGITCPNVANDIPATLAEFNMQGTGIDYYDVSLVDAFNLPMTINVVSGQMGAPANVGCLTAACATDMNSASVCPDILQIKGAEGIVGCNSACNVLHQDQYCCANAHATAATCDPNTWPVNYAAIFKQAVPYAYSYPFDDGTSVFTCVNDCSYQIIFGG
ncbi:thaumatin family protein [Reticulibacter mediterranei]|uniref:thaumatin family protein n=1 Tax=Reticulibacter mediterranei TaxID=2778369 RepID=UPI001C68A215|nr:thaumatin family protein [Reticulibacter mediterranei]